jgi:hypothetical protein
LNKHDSHVLGAIPTGGELNAHSIETGVEVVLAVALGLHEHAMDARNTPAIGDVLADPRPWSGHAGRQISPVLEGPGRGHPGGVVGCDLDQIVAESERLDSNRGPILVDEIQKLLGVAAHRPGRHGPDHGDHSEETHYQYKDGRQSRLSGAAIFSSGASAATVESHHFQASATSLRA